LCHDGLALGIVKSATQIVFESFCYHKWHKFLEPVSSLLMLVRVGPLAEVCTAWVVSENEQRDGILTTTVMPSWSSLVVL